MKANRVLRVVLGVMLIIVFAIYSYLDLSQRPTSRDYDDGTVIEKTEEPAETPEETAAPESRPEESPVLAQGGESQTQPEQSGAETGSEAESEPAGLPDIDITSWEYVLVNASNNIGDYAPQTEKLEGQELDSRIIPAMKEFVAAARAQGLNVYLSSGYRDYNTQSYLYNRKIGQGYSAEDAARIVAPPGTSEHQTGLACDITDRYYEIKNASLENTATFQWLKANCTDFGFILRFPQDKQDITGVMYEPFHFRYVGVEAAKYMTENNLCLEEFVALYKPELAVAPAA